MQDSNLFPDIEEADYLKGNQGPTNLQPLPGLPPFDVFGYLRQEQFVAKVEKIFCTTG